MVFPTWWELTGSMCAMLSRVVCPHHDSFSLFYAPVHGQDGCSSVHCMFQVPPHLLCSITVASVVVQCVASALSTNLPTHPWASRSQFACARTAMQLSPQTSESTVFLVIHIHHVHVHVCVPVWGRISGCCVCLTPDSWFWTYIVHALIDTCIYNVHVHVYCMYMCTCSYLCVWSMHIMFCSNKTAC